ncbi:hypothetical protein ACFQU2_09145 [Siccirubricoccus deserti]
MGGAQGPPPRRCRRPGESRRCRHQQLLGIWDPDIGLIATSWSRLTPPQGFNWGGFADPEADALAAEAKLAFDPEEQDRILARLHDRIVDQAMWLWVVHDLNPRALGPRLRGLRRRKAGSRISPQCISDSGICEFHWHGSGSFWVPASVARVAPSSRCCICRCPG